LYKLLAGKGGAQQTGEGDLTGVQKFRDASFAPLRKLRGKVDHKQLMVLCVK